jgi:hypothetical protein
MLGITPCIEFVPMASGTYDGIFKIMIFFLLRFGITHESGAGE